MRGPQDDLINSQEGYRPPGGKLLQRQLQWLESAGYSEVAAAAIQTALNEEARADFQEREAQFTAAPTGQPIDITRIPEPGEGIGTEDIAQMYQATAQRLGPPTATGAQWRSLGPTTIPNGQTYEPTIRVNVSGRIASVIVDPANPSHVLVGTANGGVWESFDRGGNWSPRSDYAATLSVGVLAFDPSDSSIVYCGTGEGNAWYNTPLGEGILRSTDGGTTWTTLCTDPFVGKGFYDLVVDPADGQHLLAGTTTSISSPNGPNGLFVSTDGGVNWTPRRTARTWSLSMAPTGGAAAEILAGCEDGVWASTDGGTTWSKVTLPGAPSSFDRIEADIAPSNPSVAYAWGARGNNAYLWRRASGTWTSVATPPGVQTGQAWYDWFVAADPDSETQVYCGAIEAYRGDLSGSTWTWFRISNSGPSGDAIHPDQHAIAFEPGNPSTIYVANDGGLYRSNNRGTTWQHCNNGLIISEVEYIAQAPNQHLWLIYGLQDNGSNRWTGSPIHDHVADGDGGDCGVNQSSPNIVFHTYYGMSLERSNTRGDFGSWRWIAPPVQEGSLFYPPFETSATNGDTIAMGGDALYVSRNNGTNWTRLTYPSNARASAMYIPNADRVYVGTTTGRIFRTEWNGSNWTALTTLTTPRANAYVSDLFVDPSNLSRIWATHRTVTPVPDGRVFLSVDGGTSWSDRTAGLPDLPINAIAIDPTNDNRIWVAADLGVYQSLDGGATWTDFSNGLPHMVVGDILFHPSARLLRAGTRNRGIWEISVDGIPPIPELEINGPEFLGTIASAGESDLYTFRVTTAGTYTIETSGTIDTVLSLYGPDSETTLIAEDDDSGPGRLSLLVQDLGVGQYFVRVRHYSSTGTGAYGVSVSSNNAVPIQVNGPEVQGNIGQPAESDLYTFNVTTAGEYIIETSGLTDTFIALFGPNSDTTLIAQDDDSGRGLLSRIQESLAVGTYFVRVRHYSPAQTGAYGVRVQRV